MIKFRLKVASLVLLFSSVALADVDIPEFGFRQLLELTQKNDLRVQAAHHDADAARIGEVRASRHWYPQVFVSGRLFSTTDPGASFMYQLQQRKIDAGDFLPSSLNQPGINTFGQASIGIDFPLYEGGAKLAAHRAMSSEAESKDWEYRAQSLRSYAQVASDYASLLVLLEQRTQLLDLRNNVNGILEKYSIGSKSNPVGYSGLLGLKNLLNRIEGVLSENEVRRTSRVSSVRTLVGQLPDVWRPKNERARAFLDSALVDSNQIPAAVEASRRGADSASFAIQGERSRLLPRVGIFSKADLYQGGRATAMSATSGAYLQWNLFSAPQVAAVDQASQVALGSQKRAEALQIQMDNDAKAARSGIQATLKGLSLLDESAGLLEEQTRIAKDLFREGSINALQLVEVLNRRADWVITRVDAEMNLVQMRASLFLNTTRNGGLYESEK